MVETLLLEILPQVPKRLLQQNSLDLAALR